MKREGGVSPIIATILLVGIVIAMAAIIFLWLKGFVKEEGTKFNNKNVVLVCDDVNFKASYSGGQLIVSNAEGNVPIFRVKVKEHSSNGAYTTKDITELSSKWSSAGLNQGGVFSDSITFPSGITEISIIPVLLAKSGTGEKTYTCADNYGHDIPI
jgi:FlaG/FlaF family flagellin (archaellin)